MRSVSARRFRADLLRWYRAAGRDLPWRKTRDPYAVLISELMLQQQTVVRVVPVYEAFLRAFPTLEALAAARRSDVVRVWSAIGLNGQAVRAHELAKAVVRRGGGVPKTESELRALPGVGRYTAAAIRCFAFGERVAMVDTNIRRVLSRVTVGSDDALTLDAAWELAQTLLPRRAANAYDWGQGLMDLGATVCRARGPRCGECPIQRICVAARSSAAPPLDTSDVVKETRAAYAARPPRRHEGSTRQRRGQVVRYLASLPEGASLSAAQLARGVGDGVNGGNAPLGGALAALVKAGIVQERRAPRRVARYALSDG